LAFGLKVILDFVVLKNLYIIRLDLATIVKNVKKSRKRSTESAMPQIMTTKELAKYLKLHEITICKYAAEGKIPAIRIGRVWRFDKEAIDKWISGEQQK
jgi:excisionase family DNA binding protein